MRGRVLAGAALAVAVVVGSVSATDAGGLREYGYVTKRLTLPTTNAEARDLGRDLDGDGHRDNALGQVLATLAAQGVDFNGSLSEAITNGDLVMLHSVRAPSLVNASKATWQVLHGSPTSEPDFTGAGSFFVPSTTPRSKRLPARIRDHRVKTDAGAIPVRLDIGAGRFLLRLTRAKVFATCYKSRCSSGRINGGVSMQQIGNKLLPEMADVFNLLIQRDCPGGPESCAAESTGKLVQDLFDTDDDMVVTVAELQTNQLIESTLAPDLDLVKADGTPGKDGVKDAISFGLGFGAVRARLVRP